MLGIVMTSEHSYQRSYDQAAQRGAMSCLKESIVRWPFRRYEGPCQSND